MDLPKNYKFIIPGNPINIYKTSGAPRQMIDSYQEQINRYRITLNNQYEEQLKEYIDPHRLTYPPINLPFKMIVKFYVPEKYQYNQNLTSIFRLFQFLNHTALGNIYKHDRLIDDAILHKEISDYPHTEITILIEE